MTDDSREFHPVAGIFPLMQGKEYEGLRDDIRENGLIEPIWLHADGRIIDGRNRYIACADLGVTPVYRMYDGDDIGLVKFVVSLNLKRRHLDESQRDMVAAKIANLPIGANQYGSLNLDSHIGVTLQDAADLLNVSRAGVASAKKVLNEGVPELVDAVESGEVSVSAAAEVAKLPPDEQIAVMLVGPKAVVKEAKKIKQKRQLKRREERQSITATPLPNIYSSVKLYRGDALDIIGRLDDNSIALVIADPPYNTTSYEWDRIGSDVEYLSFLADWLRVLSPKLKDNYHLFMFCDPDYQANIEAMLKDEGYPLKSRIIWEYRNLVMGRDAQDKFIENWQMCFHCGTHPLNFPDQWDDRRFMVQNHARPQSNFTEGSYHPTPKPVSLLKTLVEFGSWPGDSVLDPFAGGGSTGQACNEVGDRQCILIEREDVHCQSIVSRLGIDVQI